MMGESVDRGLTTMSLVGILFAKMRFAEITLSHNVLPFETSRVARKEKTQDASISIASSPQLYPSDDYLADNERTVRVPPCVPRVVLACVCFGTSRIPTCPLSLELGKAARMVRLLYSVAACGSTRPSCSLFGSAPRHLASAEVSSCSWNRRSRVPPHFADMALVSFENHGV